MIRDSENQVTCGKSIRQLIDELQSFENQDIEVRISIDGRETHQSISIVGKEGGHDDLVCVLKFGEAG